MAMAQSQTSRRGGDGNTRLQALVLPETAAAPLSGGAANSYNARGVRVGRRHSGGAAFTTIAATPQGKRGAMYKLKFQIAIVASWKQHSRYYLGVI